MPSGSLGCPELSPKLLLGPQWAGEDYVMAEYGGGPRDPSSIFRVMEIGGAGPLPEPVGLYCVATQGGDLTAPLPLGWGCEVRPPARGPPGGGPHLHFQVGRHHWAEPSPMW